MNLVASSRTPDMDAAFQRRLHLAAQQIMSAAAGRRCGDCKHSSLSTDGSGDCLQQVNIDGGPLQIKTSLAYACASHERLGSSV